MCRPYLQERLEVLRLTTPQPLENHPSTTCTIRKVGSFLNTVPHTDLIMGHL